jgi:cytidyltransferase-like protein
MAYHGIYPLSADPIHFGHIDIIRKAADLCEHLSVAILENMEKDPLFPTLDRVKMTEDATKDIRTPEGNPVALKEGRHCGMTEPCADDTYCGCSCAACRAMICHRPGCSPSRGCTKRHLGDELCL